MLLPFELNKYLSLKKNGVVVVAPIYEVLWRLPGGFWRFRLGEFFGVMTAEGTEVSACELPSYYAGFAELSVDEELEAFLEVEAMFVPFMQRRFPALHMHYDQFCQPATWLAEHITPCLTDEEDEVWLHTGDRTLVLKLDYSWQWLKHPSTAGDKSIYYAPHSPPATYRQVVPTDFELVDIEDLLRWRLRVIELTETSGQPDGADAFRWTIADGQARCSHLNALDEVLVGSGIRSLKPVEIVDTPFYKNFDIASVAPELHKACEDDLNTIFEVDADSRVYADQLICLAWPWANDFVFCNERDGMHWVDGRFDFDNCWFDNHIIDNIYSGYELEKIVPLLREPAAGAKQATPEERMGAPALYFCWV